MSDKGDARRIGRPPGADAEQTKREILDAALQVFAERGFEGASIREITSSVGLGHNLIRHYFGSKEDLWRAAVGHGLQPTADRLTKMFDADAAAPLRPTLRAGLELLMVEASENPAAFRLFLTEALRGGPRFEYLYDEILEPISLAMFAYAEETQEVPASVNLRVLGVYVFGAAFSPFTFEGLATRLGFDGPSRGTPLIDDVDALVEMIVAGLTRTD